MSLSIGNKTYSNLNPGSSTTQTFSHEQNTGSSRILLVAFNINNTRSVTGITYDGTSMTERVALNDTDNSNVTYIFTLANPSEGTNDIVVTFGDSVSAGSSSLAAISFTGAEVGNTGSNIASATPNEQTLTVSENSVIYATGTSVFAQSNQYTIAGSSRPFEFSHTTGVPRIVRGAFSDTGLTSGSKDVVTRADGGNVSNCRIEIKEAIVTYDVIFDANIGIGTMDNQTFEEGETKTEAALREAEEEVGIPSEEITICGELSPLYVYPSNNIIYPIIGYLPYRPQLKLQLEEVEEAFTTPLSKLLDSKQIKRETWNVRDMELEVPFWKIHRVPLWGATAMICSELVAIFNEIQQ